ncbi:MAG: response regulator, partial [Nitrospirota bacterium]
MKKKHHILLVEDEPLMRMSIAESLRHEGYQVTDVNTGSEGLNLAQSKNYDAVITDLKLPGADGIEILKASMRSSPVTQV